MKTHVCIKCKEAKPEEAFAKNRARSNGLQNRCRACQRKMAAAHYEANKERYAERNARRTTATRAAHKAVESAIAARRMRKLPCEKCGASVTEAHHDDYAKPLSVRWLCRSHHQEWHQENGPGANR